MKCTKCGTEITDGALFCTGCGAKVSDMQNTGTSQETGVENSFENIPEVQLEPEAQAEPEVVVEPEAQAEPEMQVEPEATAEPQKKHGLLVAGIGLLIAALVAVAVILVIKLLGGVSGGGDNEKKLAFQKDGVLYYVPNMDKEKDPIEIDESRDEDGWNYEFSEDGKYLYYLSRNDHGELCRVEVDKLKADSDKNSKYIVEIDSKVSGFQQIANDRLIYMDQSDRLYYYDGNQETEIDRDVTNYMTTNGSVVYYSVWNNDRSGYYYYDISTNDGDCIAKDVNLVDADWESGTIYAQDEDEIYKLTKDGKEETLVDGVDQLVSTSVSDQRIYFLKERTEEHVLYDFVDDPYETEDSKCSEPDIDDYFHEVTENDVISDSDKEYYAEYPEDKETYLYGSEMFWDSDYELYYHYNSDDGEYYYYDYDKDQWYYLDTISYDADRDAYEEVYDRSMLRDELKSENYDFTYYDLYVWNQSGDPQCLAEAVEPYDIMTDPSHQVLAYEKSETDEGQAQKISIDRIYDADDVVDMLSGDIDTDDEDYDEDYDEENIADSYVMVGSKEQELDLPVNCIEVSDDGKTAMIWTTEDDSTVVYSYSVTSEGLKKIGKVGEDVTWGSWVDDRYYFLSGTDDYGDLTVYKDQKEKVLAKNIYLYEVNVYDDGNTCAFKDDEDRDLRIFNSKGEDQKITSDVSDYQYVNEKRIVYRKNDNLYVYTGSDEDRRIVRNLGDYGTYECFGKESIF